MKKNEMGGERSTYGNGDRCMNGFSAEVWGNETT
jgi:hypothetical protein